MLAYFNYDVWYAEEILLQLKLSILLSLSTLKRNLLCRLWFKKYLSLI